jgi:hypothetical protein
MYLHHIKDLLNTLKILPECDCGQTTLGAVNLWHMFGVCSVYREGDLISPPARGIQTTLVPAGGSCVVEGDVIVPGTCEVLVLNCVVLCCVVLCCVVLCCVVLCCVVLCCVVLCCVDSTTFTSCWCVADTLVDHSVFRFEKGAIGFMIRQR